MSFCRNSLTTLSQSPNCALPESRALGYQGLSLRWRSQRKSAANGNNKNSGFPIAPARCATAVSTEITASRQAIAAAVSAKSLKRGPACNEAGAAK